MKLPSMAAAAAIAVLSSRAASAAGADGASHHARSFYVDSKDQACPEQAATLAETVTIACDTGLKSCRASVTPGGADRHLLLDCTDAETWSLDAIDASSTVEWTVELTGSVDDRMRDGASAVVRSVAEDLRSDSVALAAPVDQGERPADSGHGALAKGLVYGGFAAAVIGTTVGIVLAVDASNRNDTTNDPSLGRACSDGPCAQPAADGAPSRGPGALPYVAFGVGVAGAAAGIVGLILWPKGPSASKAPASAARRVEVAPLVGVGTLGLRGRF